MEVIVDGYEHIIQIDLRVVTDYDGAPQGVDIPSITDDVNRFAGRISRVVIEVWRHVYNGMASSHTFRDRRELGDIPDHVWDPRVGRVGG